MKKLLFTTLIALLSYCSFCENSYAAKTERKTELECPHSFLSNPPKYFYCIYSDYHNHKYDEGIKKVEKALKEIEPLFAKNPTSLLPHWKTKDGTLKEPEVYKVKSRLYLLKGMLYFKKSINVKNKEEEKVFSNFYSKLENKGFTFFQIDNLMALYVKKKLFPESFNSKDKKIYKKLLSKMEITEEELNQLFSTVQKASQQTEKRRLKYFSSALKSFQEAIKIDPENAIAYYQLGNLYSGIATESMPQESEAAEKAYYKAALILKKQGDIEGYKEALKKLKLLNPKSKYIKLLTGKNDA